MTLTIKFSVRLYVAHIEGNYNDRKLIEIVKAFIY